MTGNDPDRLCRHREQLLDAALEDSFPASDPPAPQQFIGAPVPSAAASPAKGQTPSRDRPDRQG
ncbi:hypothetical protein [Croceicoccus sp. Ery5]|uniref:hypothetical protein n=1 Tax=Croceicoccus sp. Ery5 TaxID=1703340 RepID=UPI001E50C24B|nr:hypothetical protein [Croceicoccus sp. Ery5]